MIRVDIPLPIKLKDLYPLFLKLSKKKTGVAVIRIETFDRFSLRSLKSNRFYWSILEGISEVTGYEKDELHEMFVTKYLGEEEVEIKGEKFMRRVSTSKLPQDRFNQYVNQVIDFAIANNLLNKEYVEFITKETT